MIYKAINIEIYSQIVHIIVSDDVEKEIDQIKKKFDVDLLRYNFRGFSEARQNHSLLLLNKKYLKTEIDLMSTLAHEIFHITNFIFKRIGIKVDIENDEAQAYLISLIFEKVLKIIKK